MGYRIRVFQGKLRLADLASNRSLLDARKEAVEVVDMLHADYALIVDEMEKPIERLKRSA